MREEKRSFSRNTRLMLGSILGIFFLAVFCAASPASDTPPPEDEEPIGWIPDGVWVGAFSGSDAINLGETNAEASYDGTLDFDVIAQDVTGFFSAHGFSTSENSESYGIAEFNADGIIDGTAHDPFMKTTSATFDFSVTTQGYNSNFVISETTGFSSVDWTLNQIPNCNQISGNFDAAAMQSMEHAGANVLHVQTEFTIVRTEGIAETDPENYQIRLLDLLKDADQLVSETIANQSLDEDHLWDVITKADALNSGIIIDLSCTTGNFEGHFNSAIIGIMVKLVKLAGAHPEWFTPQQINQITYAAYSVGAIGAGAPNEQIAVELATIIEAIVDNKLAENQKAPNCGNVLALYLVADIVGAESMLIKTTNAMNQYKCEGV